MRGRKWREIATGKEVENTKRKGAPRRRGPERKSPLSQKLLVCWTGVVNLDLWLQLNRGSPEWPSRRAHLCWLRFEGVYEPEIASVCGLFKKRTTLLSIIDLLNTFKVYGFTSDNIVSGYQTCLKGETVNRSMAPVTLLWDFFKLNFFILVSFPCTRTGLMSSPPPIFSSNSSPVPLFYCPWLICTHLPSKTTFVWLLMSSRSIHRIIYSACVLLTFLSGIGL